jgi:hypothetical protein
MTSRPRRRMANLREDSVVSNAMSADTDFVVHHHSVELAAALRGHGSHRRLLRLCRVRPCTSSALC